MQPSMSQFSASVEPWSVGTDPWSVGMAASVLRRQPIARLRWHYEDAFLIHALAQVGLRMGKPECEQAVECYVGRFIQPDGTIATYRLTDFNLDQVNPGRLLFPLYRATGEEKHRRAILLLREQLRRQPRTLAGGFWHKLIYPYQMWLDSAYMAAPFYAEYAATFDEPAGFDDVAHQLMTLEQHTRDPQTGLLCHGWDESGCQPWAAAQTGQSPHFWGRALGWYVMALVDVLDYLPPEHPRGPWLVACLERTLAALLAVRDPQSGLWRQVPDQGDRAGNYLEASCACMYVYSMAKGVRCGHLPARWLDVARESFAQILRRFVQVDADGLVNLHWTCGAAGLGGEPYRDGSYEYYVGEKIITNDPKGVAAFILAALEVERGPAPEVERGPAPEVERGPAPEVEH